MNLLEKSLKLHGESGTRKTTLAALLLSFFGNFEHTNLTASFLDTANAIAKKTFFAKDVPLIIDDYFPSFNKIESNEMKKIAQRILRMYGDRSGRDGENRKTIYFPRGTCIITGELPVELGKSAAARYLGVEIDKGDVDLDLLSDLQKNKPCLSQVMQGYIRYLVSCKIK